MEKKEFIEKILKGWEKENTPIFEYEKESWGPEESNALLEKDGKKWI